MQLQVRAATEDDLPLLAQMNRQLADDEGSRNSMIVSALAERMKKWLRENWQAVLFEEQDNVVGYAVFQVSSDHYDPTIPEVYVRQFFIVREARNRRLGRLAFALLSSTVFPTGAQISLDVLRTNPKGQRFWESLGFQSYSTAMRIFPENCAGGEAR